MYLHNYMTLVKPISMYWMMIDCITCDPSIYKSNFHSSVFISLIRAHIKSECVVSLVFSFNWFPWIECVIKHIIYWSLVPWVHHIEPLRNVETIVQSESIMKDNNILHRFNWNVYSVSLFLSILKFDSIFHCVEYVYEYSRNYSFFGHIERFVW